MKGEDSQEELTGATFSLFIVVLFHPDEMCRLCILAGLVFEVFVSGCYLSRAKLLKAR